MAVTLKPAKDFSGPVCQGLGQSRFMSYRSWWGHGLFQGHRIPALEAENVSALWLSSFVCAQGCREGKHIPNRPQPALAVALHLLLLSRQEIRKIQQIKKKQHSQERMFWLLLPLTFLEHIKPVVNLPKAVLFLIHTEGKCKYT